MFRSMFQPDGATMATRRRKALFREKDEAGGTNSHVKSREPATGRRVAMSSEKGISNARNNSDRRAAASAAGRLAGVAVQPRLGLLSDRYTWSGPRHRAGAGAGRADLKHKHLRSRQA